jgi:hypothetical protein
MTSPEELIGKKSKQQNNTKDNTTDIQSYVLRYSSADLLAEAVLVAGQPKLLVAKKNCDSVSIQNSINIDGKILRPLKRAAYLSKPYTFSSEQEISDYENEAKSKTLGDLYILLKSMCELFIDGDKNHISLLAADITYTHYQDRLKLTHYPFFVGKPGSGKSNNLTLIQYLGYRTFMSTDMTPANIYQFLGSEEEAMGTLCIDEANSIDKNSKLMEILKTGYITGGKVIRTDTYTGRVQYVYFTFCYKAFAGERLPDSCTANGFNERLVPIKCYDGIPKYDIVEVISPAGEAEYQQLLEQIERMRNLLFIHRVIRWFEPLPSVKTTLRGREKQLFGPLIRMYYSQEVWSEIKSVISHYIYERRERHLDTLNAYLYGLIKRLLRNKDSLELPSSEIWAQLKEELVGNMIPNRPLTYDTDRFGVISQSSITKTLMEVFGAYKPKHHGNVNTLIFNKEKLARVGMTFEISIETVDSGIVGIDGDDKYGMDKFVANNCNISTTPSDVNASTEHLDAHNEPLELTRNGIEESKDNYVNGKHRIDDSENKNIGDPLGSPDSFLENGETNQT